MKKLLIAVLCCIVVASPVTLAQADGVRAVAPILGDVAREFDPPEPDWLSGHRGVDILGQPGMTVVAALPGVVSFAGMVAGRPVVSISHGQLTTTYEPVQPSVSAGESVSAGQAIGVLEAGHPCGSEACLHWGLKQGETYLDPLSLLGGGRVRLIAAEEMESLRQRAAAATHHGLDGRVSAAGLVSPAAGMVSSPYGMRLHPIDQVWKFHDGLDIAAACGSPLVAVAEGTVVEAYYSSGYGHRLVIDHGVVGEQVLSTAYNHAQGYVVAVGDQVEQGQVIGYVGSTGASTGCHLHFQTWIDAQLVDPEPLLPR